MEDFNIENGTLLKYTGKGGDVTIPEGVTEIGDRAFKGCTGLTSVTIPQYVSKIGDWAFSGCTGLTNVSICGRPNNYIYTSIYGSYNVEKEIGDYAFKDCTSLTRVTIQGVTTIPCGAFEGCRNLTDVTIPESVTKIGVYAFRSCSRLANVTIPAGVRSIGSGAFEGCSIVNVKLPWFLKDIHISAFAGTQFRASNFNYSPFSVANGILIGVDKEKCRGIITIPSDVRVIAAEAFEGNDKITEVRFERSPEVIGYSAFKNCSSLKRVTIPGDVKEIPTHAFSGCSDLEEVTICEGVKKIAQEAFLDCKMLTEVSIPASVTEFGERAFRNTPWLDAARLANKASAVINNIMIDGFIDSSSQELVVPEGVVRIADGACMYRTGKNNQDLTLKKVTLPEGLIEIGHKGFYNNFFLENIDLPSTLKVIGADAFVDNINLTQDLVLPEGLLEIGAHAFDGCNFKSVTIPDSVTGIGEDAFVNKAFAKRHQQKDGEWLEAGTYSSSSPLNPLNVTYKGKTYTNGNINELYKLFD